MEFSLLPIFHYGNDLIYFTKKKAGIPVLGDFNIYLNKQVLDTAGVCINEKHTVSICYAIAMFQEKC